LEIAVPTDLTKYYQELRRLKLHNPKLDRTMLAGVTPDGSVLVTRDVGTQEIYALNVKWP
jgi:hypothetical protein